jgi:poly(A) polymerase
MKGEFQRGNEICEAMESNKADWDTLFEPFAFFEAYKNYLQIDISAANVDDLRKWKGWVESRLRQLTLKIERHFKMLHCHPHPHDFQDTSRPLHCSYFMGLQRKQGVPAAEGEQFDIRRTVEEFKHTVNAYTLWIPGMEISVGHIKRRSLPNFVFPGGVRPSHTSKGTWDSNRRSEHRNSSTSSAPAATTTTTEMSSESKAGSNSPVDGKKRKWGDSETLTDQPRNSKHIAVSVPVENCEGGSPNPSVGSICSSPMKDYCTNGKSEPISKDPPENVVAFSKDPPESLPIEKIATPQAHETEELEESFDFGNQVIEQISHKVAVLSATATIPPFEATSNGSPFPYEAVEELEVSYFSYQFSIHKLFS